MDIAQMQKIMGTGQPQTSMQDNSAGFTPDSMRQVMNTGSRLSPSSAAQILGSSNNWIVNNTFSTPSSEILSGQQDSEQQGIGAMKQIGADISSVGFNPMQKQLVSDLAGEGNTFAGGVQSFEQAIQPSNLEQAKGQAGTILAETMIPGSAGKLSNTATANEIAQTVGKAARGEPVTTALGNIVKGAGQKLSEMFLPTSAKEAAAIQSYKASNPLINRIWGTIAGNTSKAPSTAASTAFEKGFLGGEKGIGIQAKRVSSKLWNDTISPALKSSKATQDMKSFFNDAAAQITKNVPELGDRNSQLEALKAIEEEYANHPTASMEELQGFKEGWANKVPQKYYQGKEISGIYNNVRAELADLSRQKIYENLGKDVKQAYLDYGNLKSLQNIGKEAMTGRIKGGFGTSLKGIFESATVPIGTIGGQTIYKIGQGFDTIIGPAGATTVRELAQSMANSSTSQQTSQDTTQ